MNDRFFSHVENGFGNCTFVEADMVVTIWNVFQQILRLALSNPWRNATVALCAVSRDAGGRKHVMATSKMSSAPTTNIAMFDELKL